MAYNVSTNQVIAIVILVLWELAWKGVALWKAAQRNQRSWFIAILLINSAGVLPIIYILLTDFHSEEIDERYTQRQKPLPTTLHQQ